MRDDVMGRREFIAAAGATTLVTLAVGPAWAAANAEMDRLAKSAAAAGPVIWYESSPADQADKVVAAFNKRFPDVKVEHVRDTGGNAMAGRIIQEVQGNARTADIGTNSPSVIWQLVNREMVEKVDWAALGAETKLAPTPFTLLTTASTYVILYNTTMVKEAEAPKNWNDLLDPKWRNKIGTWIRAEAFVSLAEEWGEDRVADYIQKLNQQQPFLFKSTFPLAQQLAAGEVAVALGIYHTAQPPIRRGAPIKINVPEPAAISSLFSFIPAAGKNRDGGKLLALWLATPEGAMAYEAASGRGNPLIADTNTAKLLSGHKIAEFPPDRHEDVLRIVSRFNKMLAEGGGRAVQ